MSEQRITFSDSPTSSGRVSYYAVDGRTVSAELTEKMNVRQIAEGFCAMLNALPVPTMNSVPKPPRWRVSEDGTTVELDR